MTTNQYWCVAARPEAEIERHHFELKSAEVGPLAEGQVLVEVRWLVVTPPLRMALTSGGISRKPIPIGETMRSNGIGKVLESRNAKFAAGDLVSGNMGWQQYLVCDGRGLAHERTTHDLPESTLLHIMGAGGATAYVGLAEYAKPRLGDTLVVSAAAGNVGSTVCQLGRMQGARVVGIAGSDAKCEWLIDTLGCSDAINYKTADLDSALKKACPAGIDIYFDNVGGEVLDASLAQINQNARVVLCGGTSQYNHDLDWYGPKNYFNLVYKQASMFGFYIFNFADQFPLIHQRLARLVASEQLVYAEDIVEGVERAPDALIRVLSGANFGTQLIKIA